MEKFFRYALAFLNYTIVILVVAQVVLRYVFHAPLLGIEELLLFPAMWLYFLGSANASREGTQITANVLDIFIKTDKGRDIVKLIANIVSLIISIWITYWALDFFAYAFKTWKLSPTLYIPEFIGEGIFFIALFLMTIFTGTHMILSIRKVRKNNG